MRAFDSFRWRGGVSHDNANPLDCQVTRRHSREFRIFAIRSAMTTSPESQRNFALAIIAAGLICNPFVLGWIFSPSGAISSPSWITVISLLDLGGIIGGVRLYRARPAPPMKRIVFSIAVIALIGCSVEVGLHIIRWISHPYEFERTNRRVSLPQYRDKGWAKELFREDGRLDIGVAPYIGWRTREMHGKYINVGPDGIRRTLDFPHPPGQTPDSLFLFGGSSMWGTYVRDERTIPSGLSRFFHDRGINIVAVNYGERGFVFMQNVVHLMLLLRDGNRPKHVVFYEGANDLITPYMLGRTGVPGLQPQLEDLLARRKEPIQKQLALAAKDFVEQRVL